MGKILGSWSGMRKYLEKEMLAESLLGRIQYGCTAYTGMDGCRVFEIIVDGDQFKRFSLETVNTYLIQHKLKEKREPFGTMEYWEDFWCLLNDIPIQLRTEYTDAEFCHALGKYRNQSIQESIGSENPLVRMFAVFDRRVGKRTLVKLKDTIEDQPEWLQKLYCLRFKSEKI